MERKDILHCKKAFKLKALKKNSNMHNCFQDYCPDPSKYGHEIVPLERSKPKIPIEDLLDATKPMEPFPWNKQTDMPVDSAGLFGTLINGIKSIFFK